MSVVIPTRDSARTLRMCLQSLSGQGYPKDRTELIVVDAYSQDATIEIAEAFGATVVRNPLLTGEAGKALGSKLARGDYILFVDSDNVLASCDWLERMVEPLLNHREVVSSEALYYAYDRSDPIIIRYCALMGVDDPISLYLGFYGRFSFLKQKWSEIPLRSDDKGPYIVVTLQKGVLPTMGANGFLIRSDVLRRTIHVPYLFDVDIMHDLVVQGYRRVARVKVSVKHLYALTFSQYLRKTHRRIRDYYLFQTLRKYHWGSLDRIQLLKLIFGALVVYPLFRDAVRGYRIRPDPAWFLNWPLTVVTIIVYGLKQLSLGFPLLRQARRQRN